MKKRWMIAVLVAAMVLAMIAPVTAQAAEPGWQKKDGYWYYYYSSSDSDYAHGGTRYIEGEYYYFDNNGRMKANYWINEDGNWYYAGSDGAYVRGWNKIGGVWYYFAPENTFMYSGGRYKIDGKYYYFSDSGAMLTGWIKDFVSYGDGYDYTNWYYADSSGALASGWKQISGTWYYFHPTACYMYSDGVWKINEKYYYFYPNGAMGTGWIKQTFPIGGGQYYTFWYYADGSGELAREWKQIGGVWYYFDLEMVVGSRMIDGKLYVFQGSGTLATKPGWVKVVYFDDYTNWYYLKNDGTATEGWKSIGGAWYYFYPGEGFMVSSTVGEIDGKLYVFTESGALSKGGWVKVGTYYDNNVYWAYANAEGIALTNWQKIGGQWYYFNEDGLMMANAAVIDGQIHLFTSGGAWIKACDYKGWVKGFGVWYYSLDTGGNAATGFITDGGKKYYLDPSYYYMYSDILDRINGEGYYFGPNGDVQTGWIKRTYSNPDGSTHTTWYYANGDGILLRGWQYIKGVQYYFEPDEFYMYANCTKYIDGKTYVFDASGACLGEIGFVD